MNSSRVNDAASVSGLFLRRIFKLNYIAHLCCGSILALIGLFVGCDGPAEVKRTPFEDQAEAIRSVIRESAANQKSLNESVEKTLEVGRVASPEDYFAAVIVSRQRIDQSGCPKDYCDARAKVTHLWQKQLQLATQHKAEVSDLKQWNLIILQGEKENAKPFEKAILHAHQQLEKAGDELATIAEQYGVDLEYEFKNAMNR